MTVMKLSFAPGAVAPSPVLVENVGPTVDCARYPVKRETGDVLTVFADIFREGHDKIAAVVKYRRWTDSSWREAEMKYVDNDRWEGSFLLAENTRYIFTVEAFPDDFETWRDEITKKLDAGLDVGLELREGTLLLQDVLTRTDGEDATTVSTSVEKAAGVASQTSALSILLDPAVIEIARRNRSRAAAVEFVPHRSVIVDRQRARFAAWYEMFPRSAGTVPGQSATFNDVILHLPRVRSMGFNVLYFTPIHPIGSTNRKGKNNTLNPAPDDPGVPYAIGSALGGHDAIEPGLGTIADFRELVIAAEDHGIEIALDIALQASPDHPWAREHPEWFTIRPDGSIKYAENPPKKYEDIYPINFQNEDWQGLWNELKRVIDYWVHNGVKTFRVDNPHTKPTAFWEWIITEVHRTNPEVIFLSEAFTRPKVMRTLAKAGFAQSYTYFTWRNFKQEITEYATELTQGEMKEYFRGNLFTNTHDILPYILQEGGRPAFRSRVVLAATLSSVYGIYSGYELCENTAVAGKEEYLNSEKYEYKVWDWDRPGNIVDEISRLNQIRREHVALQEYDNLTFLDASSDSVICYIKSLPDHDSQVLVVVNLDPFQPHESTIEVPHRVLGTDQDVYLQATELFTGNSQLWQGSHQSVYLDPNENPAMIFALKVWKQMDYEEPCF